MTDQANMDQGAAPAEPARQFRPSDLMTVYADPASAAPGQGQPGDAQEHAAGAENPPVDGAEDASAEDQTTAASEFDPTSPAARHFQSLADRKIAEKEKQMADLKTQLDKLNAERELQKLHADEDPRPSEPQQPQAIDDVLFSGVPDWQYGDEDTREALSPFESTIDGRLKQIVGVVVRNIASAQQQALQAQQTQSAQAKIEAFGSEIPPDKAQAYVELVGQFRDAALANPDMFLKLAREHLSISNEAPADEAPATPASPSPGRPVVRQVTAAIPRPTSGATTAPYAIPAAGQHSFNPRDRNRRLEEKVRESVRAVLRGGGGA